ncbi:MFS transporter [Gordonia sp. ABSL1-1]|uniref:MFS transporter n=1 Tax=Gordonia sp. ABSL1-1 TaxID=3053923 RepID=UPI00257315F3|nr:MFS transporter [Gordonia sp. ABSL1-1]MDL9936630.1 MFS transporter [Gordonia sp. ABSL1-1]
MTTSDIRPDAATAEVEDKHHARRWWILVVLALAQLMVVLDATIVNIALPAAQDDLGFSDELRQWVVTAYSLTFGGLLLLGGRLNDILGRKQCFMIGLTGFALASALGGWSPTFEVLIAARALQGVFGALLAPAALSLLTVTFAGSAERARAFGIYGAISGAGGATGLLLGGVLTEYVSWNWCLYVNVVFAAVALVGAAKLIPSRKPDSHTKLDLPGTALVTAGLFALVYGLANSETNGWSDTWTLTFIGVGVALLAAFVFAETRVAHPLLPMRVVTSRIRGASYLVMGVAAVGMFSLFLFLTYYLQSTLGYSPVVTGVAFLPMVAALASSAALLGNAVQRVGPRFLVGGGMIVSGIGILLLMRVDEHTSYVTGILPSLILGGLGLGAVFATAMAYSTYGVDAEDAGVASATVNTAQQVGGSIGVSVLSSIAGTAATGYVTDNPLTGPPSEATLQALKQGAELASYHAAFAWASGIFIVGGIIVALIYPLRAPQADPNAETAFVH